jgi:hypothetical protein
MCQVRYASATEPTTIKMVEISGWLPNRGRRADNSMQKLNHMGDVVIDCMSVREMVHLDCVRHLPLLITPYGERERSVIDQDRSFTLRFVLFRQEERSSLQILCIQCLSVLVAPCCDFTFLNLLYLLLLGQNVPSALYSPPTHYRVANALVAVVGSICGMPERHGSNSHI